MDSTCQLCFEIVLDPTSTTNDILFAIRHLQRKRAVKAPFCTCYMKYIRGSSEDEFNQQMFDIEVVEMTIDECQDYLWQNPGQYATIEDWIRDVAGSILSGFEDVEINWQVFSETAAELHASIWASPHYVERDLSPYDLIFERFCRP